MSEPISVLVVDDEEESRVLLAALLETLGLRAIPVHGGEQALSMLLAEGASYDGVILDVLMPGIDGLETLKRYRSGGGRHPVVMVSALDEASTALQAVRLGANDYLTKPFDGEELREVLERALGIGRAPAIGGASQMVGLSRLGHSTAMQQVAKLIDRIADVDVPILITGESGVGKDVAARDIHAKSSRRDKVFVKINCAALPGELLESELFGHERGSFTGAARTKPGQFELADGGTLFLDEIGEMPVSLQAKLLQALQDGEFYRVGGQRRIRVDSRVICATNRNLQKAILEGAFREDLYYRLNVIHFEIPPLRERREDIPALVEHFAEKYGKRYNRSIDIPPVVMSRFLTWDWPGNIRELENLVRRLVVLREPSYVLSELRDRPGTSPAPTPAPSPPASFAAPPTTGYPTPATGYPAGPGFAPSSFKPPPLAAPPTAPMSPMSPMSSHGVLAPPGPSLTAGPDGELRIDLKEVGRQAAHVAEREAIVAMLGHTGGNKREAAERLGISYKAILYKIREFGIGRPRLPRRPLSAEPAVAVPADAFGPPLAEAVAALGAGSDPDEDLLDEADEPPYEQACER